MANRPGAGRTDRRHGRSPSPPAVEHLYGRKPVLEALRAERPVLKVWLADSAHGASVEEVRAAAAVRGVRVGMTDRESLDELLGEVNHQGVVAEAAPFAYRSVEEVLALAETRGEPPLVLALDSLQDPQNFGTLLRTALASGTHGVLIPEHRSVGVTPAVSKASAGAVERLAVARVTNLVRALGDLKERGVWVYGLAVGGGQPFWEVDWRGGAAVVVGAEGPGLGRLVRETCDVLVQIPMAADAPQSLNAAVAGSLVLYEAFRQRSVGRA